MQFPSLLFPSFYQTAFAVARCLRMQPGELSIRPESAIIGFQLPNLPAIAKSWRLPIHVKSHGLDWLQDLTVSAHLMRSALTFTAARQEYSSLSVMLMLKTLAESSRRSHSKLASDRFLEHAPPGAPMRLGTHWPRDHTLVNPSSPRLSILTMYAIGELAIRPELEKGSRLDAGENSNAKPCSHRLKKTDDKCVTCM